ncbi:hypothetical protein CSH63_17815 [Micromonospora tulbaghiae]|uniref:Uncharacterized protein n=1 Tax=Micromonospora tulbaghiae TaxID=479978 RepID=A0A386WNQ3_9ACTN|nr:DUF6085 family protein [Micromonospora tulbaghiae]AYF29288.1 hypothetical protein CSH63_17815 [Micromonospora tulbaghiae]
MTAKPYTDADVHMVAGIFIAEAKKNPVDRSAPLWMGAQGRLLLGPTEHDIARAVLDALAAAGRLAPVDDDPRHIIDLRADGWTLKHPLACRRGDLFDCPVNRAASQQLDGPPPESPGRYVCWLGDRDLAGMLILGDRIDEPAEADPDTPVAASRAQDLPSLVFNAISRALQPIWPISVPLPVVRERCTAAVLQALDATWRPARPGDTPGELTPEHGPAQPIHLNRERIQETIRNRIREVWPYQDRGFMEQVSEEAAQAVVEREG